MGSVEDECFLFPGDDLFTALGHRSSCDENAELMDISNKRSGRQISRRQHRLQRALAQGDCYTDPTPAPTIDIISPGRRRWHWAFHQIRSLEDPWKQFNFDNISEEKAVRHRYSALKKEWVEDHVRVKIDPEVFASGAMRDCFRMKKLSNWVHCADWSYASNYVAKQYKECVPKSVYFEDVRLQMEAKLWGEEYNRSNPPKKVDFVQMSVLEFVERPGNPLFHLEHFIEGDYKKYNSNSGFVDETLRCTPQAFSHFTFERSAHQLMVIDIQGVGDLYTDPQIHTADGNEYSDGNLGTRGMALFFHSHQCNAICSSLGLSKFDLTPREEERLWCGERSGCSATRTVVREGILPVGSPDLYRQRLYAPTSPTFPSSDSGLGNIDDEVEELDEDFDDDPLPYFRSGPRRIPRRRYESSCSELDHEEDRLEFHITQRMLHQPSCLVIQGGVATRTLGNVHHELAKQHKTERFGTPVDWNAVVFHEKNAAEMGCVEAIINVGQYLQNLTSDLLQECPIKAKDSGGEGLAFMTKAAELGDRSAMIFVANAYHHGCDGANGTKNWQLAVEWYGRAVATTGYQDDEGCYDSTIDHPIYTLLCNSAQLYNEGGYELSKDCERAAELFEEAAEAATCAMKGRFACRMYEMAEMARCQAQE